MCWAQWLMANGDTAILNNKCDGAVFAPQCYAEISAELNTTWKGTQ